MRVRNEHWQLLLSFCEQHGELITNKFNGPDGKANGNQLWQNLCLQLNSLGFGEKSITEWRKTLIDWKSKTKAKAAKINRELKKTGGGPPDYPPLTDLEKRLIDLMGVKAVDGDNVEELGFGKVPHVEVLVIKPALQFDQPNTSQSSDAVQALIEHDYAEEHLSQASCHAKEVRATPTSIRSKRFKSGRKSTRVYSKDRPQMSRQLLQLNEESLENLKKVAENTSSIAQSLKSVATSLQMIQKQFGQSISGSKLDTD